MEFIVKVLFLGCFLRQRRVYFLYKDEAEKSMKNIIIGILAVIGAVTVLVLLAGVYRFNFTNGGDRIPGVNWPQEVGCTMEAKLCPDGSTVGRSGPRCEFSACPDIAQMNEDIRVTSPLPEAVIKNPVMITGEARGRWFFEASFPITIVGDNGMILGSGVAQATGDWMTDDFVPFEATINISESPVLSGSIILSRDNPSGLPENDAKILIPIRFSL